MLGRVRVGASEHDPVGGHVRQPRPQLLAVHDPLVAVGHGPGPQTGQIRARLRLAEQLAPQLGSVEDPGEPAALLLLRAVEQDGGTSPADSHRVERATDPGGAQLGVDGELLERRRIASPRAGPVGRHVAGFGELSRRRVRMLGQPRAHLGTERLGLRRQVEPDAARHCHPRPGRRRSAAHIDDRFSVETWPASTDFADRTDEWWVPGSIDPWASWDPRREASSVPREARRTEIALIRGSCSLRASPRPSGSWNRRYIFLYNMSRSG